MSRTFSMAEKAPEGLVTQPQALFLGNGLPANGRKVYEVSSV
jgi:hypothetical protein